MAEASPNPINYWTFGTGEMIVANDKFIVEVNFLIVLKPKFKPKFNPKFKRFNEWLKVFSKPQSKFEKVHRILKLKTSF